MGRCASSSWWGRAREVPAAPGLIVSPADGTVVLAQAPAPTADAKLHKGIGVVIATIPRMNRLIVSHEEIKGFMAAMEMSYPVTPPDLLNGLNPGDKIGFTIDAGKSTIVTIEVIEAAK